jgi:membrane protease YdiL (CAAX protease family)
MAEPLIARKPLPIPLPAVMAIQVVQSSVLIALFVAAGILTAPRCKLGAPLLEAWLAGQNIRSRIPRLLFISIPAGVTVALAIIATDAKVFAPHLPKALSMNPSMAAWRGLLASFYGGIAEELMLRFGLMTMLAWFLNRILHPRTGRSESAVMWTANIVAALLFGAGHLPAARLLAPLTTLLIARIIILNAAGGILFGYLYWKRGLESAMLSHFSADITMHAILVAA